MNDVRVVGAVIGRGATVLACRRARGKANGGQWEFPGGKVEAGESDAEALARELTEELGLTDVSVGGLVGEGRSVSDDGRAIHLVCYRVALGSDRPQRGADHAELRWVGVADLGALDWSVADRPIVRALATAG
ncbi:MAG: (deoxy)nucleoside triphosphate pyrophosphohydrolase [Bifidobacteriaceae bacterium]|nr:(deoxy)nucleoside triphosphate pyrophosphohydrolase [Bifidobacteriaceae bacterium]